jgi:hypothetical protein
MIPRSAKLLAAAAALIAAPATARAAEPPDVDGAYGRLDGDLSLELGAGVATAAGAPALALEGRALYLETAGVLVHYADALGGDDATTTRAIGLGVAMRPLFLARFAKDAERGPPRLDLLVDSLTLDLGALWSARRGASLAPDPGLALGLSVAIPLGERATGAFLGVRAALLLREADPRGRGDLDDTGALLSLTLAWHQILDAHLVDAGDRRPR